MKGIGRGPLPDPSTVNQNEIDRWIVPADNNPTKPQPRKFYELIQSVWVLKPNKVIDHSDPVLLANGSVTDMHAVTEHLITDYQSIVNQGL